MESKVGELSPELIERARRVADELDEAYAIRRRVDQWSGWAYAGERPLDVPVLHLEDISAIPFVEEVPGVREYQHRARIRAGSGDIFAAVTEPVEGYEEYNREVLGLDPVELVVAEPVGGPMQVARSCGSGEAYERLVELAGAASRLDLHPYMATEAVWELARRLTEDGVQARVIGPPPAVLWVANDKARIAEINARLFDTDWNVETEVEREPRAMARRLLEFAETYECVGLKRTRCASAMGNIVFESTDLLEAGPRTVLRRVQRFLNRTEWEEGEEVLVVEWFDADHSPSTQTWIPPKSVGMPRLDGIYEQILESEERIFVGSRPSALGAAIESSIAEASLAVGVALQELGYVGRCSFDFVVSLEGDGDFAARMIECNGRWGGTSTPMHFVDRLTDGKRPPYVAQDFVDPGLVGTEFREVCRALEGELFRPETGEGRFVLYNVGPLAEIGKIDVISIGRTQEEAARGVEEILPNLLGLGGE